ncbi:MAG TPA: UPF0158 family protein [Crinalium sp.]
MQYGSGQIQHVVDEMDTLSDELHAYLNRKTGKLITISNNELEAIEAGDDLDSYSDWEQEAIQVAQNMLNTDDYLRLPSKFDIHEYVIMERFCYEIEDTELSNELLFQIKSSGAFQRFKQAIHRYNVTKNWYHYRQKALEKIAIDWLEANSISYTPNEE